MLFGLTATAQESISVNEVLIAPGKQAMMEVMYEIPSDPSIEKVVITEAAVRGTADALITRRKSDAS